MKIKVGILGATGILGVEYLKLLHSHPWFEIAFLGSSEKRVGSSLEGLPLSLVDDVELAKKKCRLVFSALPSSIAAHVDPLYASQGFRVISHASCHRMEKDIPLIIPEINGEELSLIKNKGCIIAKPNCAINSFLIPLAPLHQQFGLEKIQVTTLQSISGAGFNALSAMEMFDNVIPYIAEEEEKLETEPLKILNHPHLKISAQCNRTPTLHGHFACVSVKFLKKPTREEILRIWKEFPGLKTPSAPSRPIYYCEDMDRPQTRHDLYYEEGMGVTVGRLRECPLFDYRFVALSHNARRGGAGGGVLIGELLYQKRGL